MGIRTPVPLYTLVIGVLILKGREKLFGIMKQGLGVNYHKLLIQF